MVPLKCTPVFVSAGVLALGLTFVTCWRRRRRRFVLDVVLDRSPYFTEKHDLKVTIFGAGAHAIPMWVADMDFPICSTIHRAICDRAAHPTFGYTYQPQIMWDAVSKWYLDKHGWAVDPSCFIFSTGVVLAASFCVRAFTNLGDAVLVMTPLYAPLQRLVEGEGRQLVRCSLTRSTREVAGRSTPAYSIDFELLEAQFVRERVRLLIFCNPHNPGSHNWPRQELQRLVDTCRRHGVVVVSDEIHADWCLFGSAFTPLATLAAPSEVVTLGGPGKTFAIPGLQSAFVIVQDEGLRRQYLSVTGHTHANEGGVFATVATLAAYRTGGRWLEEAKAYVEANVLEVEVFLAEHVPEVLPWRPSATFLMWLDFSGLKLTAAEVKALLVQAGLVLSPGEPFGEEAADFQRINIACPRQVLREALRRLALAVRQRHSF